MRILLAGATGVLGRAVIPLLIQAGHHVLGTTRQAAKFASIAAMGAEPVLMNALNRAQAHKVLAESRVDLVMHQLSDLSDRNFTGNATLRRVGTRNLVDGALAQGVQRMIAQSISWIHASGPGPAREEDPWDLDAVPPRRSTVLSVQALEAAVAEIPHGVVLRYGCLYGAGTWYARNGFIGTQLRTGALLASEDITSFVHVNDAAQATLQALDWATGAYAIVDDEPVAAKDWMALFARLIGAQEPRATAVRNPWARGSSNAKARSRGWSPYLPTWRMGFSEILQAPSSNSEQSAQ